MFGIQFNVSETLSQLRYGPNRLQNTWSWGSRGFININNSGLLFRVSAFKHKGYVFVTLDGSDTYNVHLLNMKFDVKKTIEGVYAEDLTDIVDSEIELVPNYDQKVREHYNIK